MKIRVTLKDPDTMHDCVDDYFKSLRKKVCPDGIHADEWNDICDERADKAKSSIADRWMEYGEYLEVEFDLEAMTETVIEVGK